MSNVPQNPDAPVAIDLSNAGQDPIQTMYDPSRLTEPEKKILMDWGWDGVSPVPADLAKRMGVQSLASMPLNKETFNKHSDLSQAGDDIKQMIQADRDALPAGFRMPSQDLNLSELENGETLTDAEALEKLKHDPQLLQQYKAMMGGRSQPQQQPVDPAKANRLNSAIQQAKDEQQDVGAGLGPVVGEAARQIESGMNMQEDPLMKEREAQQPTEQPAQQPAEQPVQQPEQQAPLTEEQIEKELQKLREEVPMEDQEAYRTAIMSFAPFEKTYKIGGAAEVTFREMEHETEQVLLQQELFDRLQGRTKPESFQQLQTMGKYYLVMASTTRVKAADGEPVFTIPKNQSVIQYLSTLPWNTVQNSQCIQGDTWLRRWGEVAETNWYKGAIRPVINRLYNDFSVLSRNLQILASRPDFMNDQP